MECPSSNPKCKTPQRSGAPRPLALKANGAGVQETRRLGGKHRSRILLNKHELVVATSQGTDKREKAGPPLSVLSPKGVYPPPGDPASHLNRRLGAGCDPPWRLGKPAGPFPHLPSALCCQPSVLPGREQGQTPHGITFVWTLKSKKSNRCK